VKKITKTALILAESLLVASNSYADDSEGFHSTVIQCGAPGSSFETRVLLILGWQVEI
jgi:hypothetical protein